MRFATRPLLARLNVIAETIRAGSFPNAQTLSRELEVNPRTVQRDISDLRDRFGAPIKYDDIRHGYYFTALSEKL